MWDGSGFPCRRQKKRIRPMMRAPRTGGVGRKSWARLRIARAAGSRKEVHRGHAETRGAGYPRCCGAACKGMGGSWWANIGGTPPDAVLGGADGAHLAAAGGMEAPSSIER
jgi:hypothetical protein